MFFLRCKSSQSLKAYQTEKTSLLLRISCVLSTETQCLKTKPVFHVPLLFFFPFLLSFFSLDKKVHSFINMFVKQSIKSRTKNMGRECQRHIEHYLLPYLLLPLNITISRQQLDRIILCYAFTSFPNGNSSVLLSNSNCHCQESKSSCSSSSSALATQLQIYEPACSNSESQNQSRLWGACRQARNSNRGQIRGNVKQYQISIKT